MNRTIKLVAIFGLVCGGAGALVWSHRPTPSSHPSAERADTATRDELAELRQEITRTQRELRDVRDRAAPPLPVAAAQDQRAEGPAPAAEQEPARLTMEDARDTLEARFYSETSDRAWGREARQRIEMHLDAVLAGDSRLLSIDCRASLCRAEVRHVDLATHQSFMQNAFVGRPVPWEGPTLASYRDDTARNGGVVSVLFFGREGSSALVEE